MYCSFVLDAIEGVHHVLENAGGVYCVLHCVLEAVEGVLEVLEVLEVMRGVPVCMLEAVGGVRYVLKLLEVVLYASEGVLCASLKS